MSPLSILIRRVGMAVLPLILVAGCASSRQEQAARAQLERAQAAYRQAQADPNVQAYAQLWLADAQKAVQAAEQAKTLEDTLQLSRESSDVLLQKRDREVKAARAEAAAKAREAEQARAASEARARTTDTTAREVEQARLQAEAEARAYAAEQAKTAALAKELSDLKAQQTDRGLVLTVGDVLFAAGKADVAPGGQRSVDKLAEFLKKYPRRRVLIEGHSDNTGNEDFNLKLLQQRADAVRALLLARGIAPERITTRGYGPKFPIVDNDTPAGRQQNRRVEVLVLNEGANVESSSR